MSWRVRDWSAKGLVLGLALVVVSFPAMARAQASETIPAATADALHALTRQAAVIFAGRVVAVRQVAVENGAAGVVEIDFAVEDAVRGVGGGSYTLREWAGLWPAGEAPLHVGQRFLMLLHAPGASGLSAPVAGPDGAIPIRGGVAPEPASEAGVTAFAESAAGSPETAFDGRALDLRWITVRAERPVSYAEGSVARPRLAEGGGVTSQGVEERGTQVIRYARAMAQLRVWEVQDAAAR